MIFFSFFSFSFFSLFFLFSFLFFSFLFLFFFSFLFFSFHFISFFLLKMICCFWLSFSLNEKLGEVIDQLFFLNDLMSQKYVIFLSLSLSLSPSLSFHTFSFLKASTSAGEVVGSIFLGFIYLSNSWFDLSFLSYFVFSYDENSFSQFLGSCPPK